MLRVRLRKSQGGKPPTASSYADVRARSLGGHPSLATQRRASPAVAT